MIVGNALVPQSNTSPKRELRRHGADPFVRVVEPAEILPPAEPVSGREPRGSAAAGPDLGPPARGLFIDILV